MLPGGNTATVAAKQKEGEHEMALNLTNSNLEPERSKVMTTYGDGCRAESGELEAWNWNWIWIWVLY